MTCTEKSTLRPIHTIKTVQVTVSMFKPIRRFSVHATNMRKKRFTPKVDDAGDVAECQEDAQNDKAGAYEIGQ